MHLVSSTLPFLAGLPTSFQFADSFHLPIIISIYLSTLQSYLLLPCGFSSDTFIYKKDPKKMQPPPFSPTSYPSIRNTQFLSRHFPSHSSLPLAILALHDPRFSLSLLPSLSLPYCPSLPSRRNPAVTTPYLFFLHVFSTSVPFPSQTCPDT